MLPILAAAACFAGSGVARAGGPYLLNAQQATFATRPEYLRDHFHHIDTLPFDGMVVSSDTGHGIMDGTPRTHRRMSLDFAPMNGLVFRRMTHNFALVNVDRPADFFDDWSVTIENFRTLARVLRGKGFTGIFLDNEEYQRPLFNYPEDCSDPAKSLAEYLEQARLRGRQIMQAIASEYPEIVVLVAHGPYSSFEGTPDEVRAGQTQWEAEDLRGAFSAGLIEGTDSRSRFVDGGELYTYRSAADFQASYEFRKTLIAAPEAACPFIPAHLQTVWPLKVGIGFGVFNQRYQNIAMSPAILRHTLEAALRRCDEYVWLYSENQNWNGPGEFAPTWIEAIDGARAAAASEPLDRPPWISLTSPADGSLCLAPGAISIEATVGDGDGSVVKVEFFGDGAPLGEVTSPPFVWDWPGPPAGSHILTAIATDDSGGVAESARVVVNVTGSFLAAVNFQPAGVTAPIGYLPDLGELYGYRGHELAYGWNVSHADATRLRRDGRELRLATLCHFRAGGEWEIGVPAGRYFVTVGIGDLDYASTHTINVEGVSYWSGQFLDAGEFAQRTREVFVTDGRITIDQGDGEFEATRIDYVLIAAAGASPAGPTGLTASASSSITIRLAWADNSSNEDGFKIERSTDAGFAGALEIATVPADTATHLDTALTPGTTYFYRIRATNAAGDSAFSNLPSATPPLPDTDRDGVADALEIAPCLVGVDDRWIDSDGDGFSNVAEQLAGTDGLDNRSHPQLAITGVTVSGGVKTIALAYPTAIGRAYALEFTDSLADGVWTRLDGSDRAGDGAWQSATDTAASATRMYRLQIFP